MKLNLFSNYYVIYKYLRIINQISKQEFRKINKKT